MDADVFGMPALRTYSRAKTRVTRKHDDVFCEKALKSLKQNLSSPVGKETPAPKERKKRQSNNSNKSGSEALLTTLVKNKKTFPKKRVQRKPSADITYPVHDLTQSDVLFCEEIQPMKSTKKPRAKKKRKESQNKISRLEHVQGLSTESKPSNDQPEIFAVDFRPQGNQTKDLLKEFNLPVQQLRSEDKVSDWLALSDDSKSQDNDTSKELWRGAQQLTSDEMRNKLFPDEFYQNLRCILPKSPVHSVRLDRYAKAQKAEFLSKLAIKSVDKPRVNKSPKSFAEVFMHSDDVTDIYADTSSGLQADTQTGTETYTQTDTQTNSQPGTLASSNSRYTETLTSKQTAFSSKYRDSQTGTGTTRTNNSTETDTQTDTDDEFCTATPVYSDQPTYTPSRELQPGTQSTSQFVDHFTEVSGKYVHCSSAGEEHRVEAATMEPTILHKDPRVAKYICSTMRRSTSHSNMVFPSELSAVTDPAKNQQRDEQTPKPSKEGFKVPGSPTKAAVVKDQRKGTLQPKNSTRLFTTGFVEIADTMPQLSIIWMDHGSKAASPTIPAVVVEDVGIELPPKMKKPRKQNVKTSTPNTVNSHQQFQFEIDVSSVHLDSDEDDLLHFNESREVNSEEIIHLSTTVIEAWQEPTITPGKGVDSIKPAKQSNQKIKRNKTEKKNHSSAEDRATQASSDRKKINCDLKQKPLPSPTCKHVGVVKTVGKTKHTSTGRAQKHLSALKRRPSYSSRISTGRTRLGSACSGSVRQSLRKTSSNKLIGAIYRSRRAYPRPSESTVIGNSVNNDVYDIDESAINMPSLQSLRSARAKELYVKEPKDKMLSKKNTKTKQKNTTKMLFQRKSSEISFDPKRPLFFSSSTLAARSVCSRGSYKSESHGYLSRYCDQQMLSMDRNNDANGSDADWSGRGSKHKWSGGVPVCTLMNEEFRCPLVKMHRLVWKTDDTRTRQVILDTVPIDTLM